MYQNILVPIDGSPTSDSGLDEAIKLAKLSGGRLRLLHVVDEMPYMLSIEGYGALSSDVRQILKKKGEDILTAARAKAERGGIAVDAALLDGFSTRLVDHVMEQAAEWKADVIVLGTHGRRGVGRLLIGSDAEQIVRAATVPVLLVRSREAAAASRGAAREPASTRGQPPTAA